MFVVGMVQSEVTATQSYKSVPVTALNKVLIIRFETYES